MSFSEMLNHTCDIYHIVRTDQSPGYGLDPSPAFSYPEEPDEVAVPCHFGVKNGASRIVQHQPQANLESRIKLSLPIGADVRVNDKIVNRETGYAYTAEPPTNIRNHHLVVWIYRTDRQAPV